MSTKATTSFPSLLTLGALCVGLSATGCMQKPLCEELSDCGGPDPLGTWQLAPGHPSCSEDLYLPATDPRLLGAEATTARNAPIEPALYDWCYLLVTSGAEKIQRKPPRFYAESAPIGFTSLTYGRNAMTGENEYTLGITRVGTFYFDFPAVCMRNYGAMDGRPVRDAAGMIVDPTPSNVCKQLQNPLASAGLNEGSYPNTICEPNKEDPEGCLCQFDVSETFGSSGTYSIQGNTIRHEPTSTSTFPSTVTYCNKGGSLDLTGEEGSYLFNVKGLRTMNLLKTQ